MAHKAEFHGHGFFYCIVPIWKTPSCNFSFALSAGKKRKSNASMDLDPEETARRERQKKLRDIALKLRANGKEYNPKKFKRLQKKGIRSLEGIDTERPDTIKDGHKPRKIPQVIIIPIFWNKREDEKQTVLDVTLRAQSELRRAGLRCDTDTTHKQTPGQKFRAWEEKGVLVRVEVGPREAEAGACILAICKTPGEVADKKRMDVGQQLVDAAKAALGIENNNTIEGIKDDMNETNELETMAHHEDLRKSEETSFVNKETQNGRAQFEHKVEMDPGVAEKCITDSATKPVKANKINQPSGDDLDGDFVSEAFIVGEQDNDSDDEEKSESKSKSNKKKNKRKSGKERSLRKIEPAAWEDSDSKIKRKEKVVVF